MDVHPRNAAAAAAAMGEMFPHEPAAMESEEHNLEWLSFFVEDCLSTSTNPQSAELAPTIMASQGIAKQNLPPRSSSNARKRKRSLASVISETEDQHYFTLFVEPPLLLLDQKQWLAESELILPKKDNDQELLHQPEQEQQEQEQQQEQQQEQEQEQEQQQEQEQEQEQKEEKYKMSAITQFQQERHVRKCSLVRKCSRCLSTQTPQWRDGPSGSLCNACGLKIKAKRFTTVSESHYDQEIDKEQDTGKRSRKKKRHYDQEIDEEQDTEKRPQKKKAVYVNEEMPAEEPVKRCTHCMSYKTPQWRTGPLGPKSLCNACGMRFKSGRLLPEYRPANSPTYVSNVHSNSHRKVIQLRQSFAHPWE